MAKEKKEKEKGDESFLLHPDFMVLPKPCTGCPMFSKGTVLFRPRGFAAQRTRKTYFAFFCLWRRCYVVFWFSEVRQQVPEITPTAKGTNHLDGYLRRFRVTCVKKQ